MVGPRPLTLLVVFLFTSVLAEYYLSIFAAENAQKPGIILKRSQRTLVYFALPIPTISVALRFTLKVEGNGVNRPADVKVQLSAVQILIRIFPAPSGASQQTCGNVCAIPLLKGLS